MQVVFFLKAFEPYNKEDALFYREAFAVHVGLNGNGSKTETIGLVDEEVIKQNGPAYVSFKKDLQANLEEYRKQADAALRGVSSQVIEPTVKGKRKKS